MKNIVFRRYQKIKYLFRIKHFRGRSVHSPFMYSVIREALMGAHNEFISNSSFYQRLRRSGMKRDDASKITRLYYFLRLGRFALGARNYGGEDILILSQKITLAELFSMIDCIKYDSRKVCLVMPSLYKTSSSRERWRMVVSQLDVVTVDIFSIGLIFVDDNLLKQSYKIRI